MRLKTTVSVLLLMLLAPNLYGDIIPSNVRVSVNFGGLGGSTNDTISDFGTATTIVVPTGGTVATLNAPVTTPGAFGDTVTISGSAATFATTGNLGAAIDIDFDLTGCGCGFGYVFTATATQTDPSSVPSSYGISAGSGSSTAFLPLPGTSPISLSGQILATDTESFGFLTLLSDFGGDGFNAAFTYELVLTALDPAVHCVPEPSAFLCLSVIGALFVVRKKRHVA